MWMGVNGGEGVRACVDVHGWSKKSAENLKGVENCQKVADKRLKITWKVAVLAKTCSILHLTTVSMRQNAVMEH